MTTRSMGSRGGSEAVKLIDELKERSAQHYAFNSLFAEAYIGLGEKDEAMSWLERAYEPARSVDGLHYVLSRLGCFTFRTALSGISAPHELTILIDDDMYKPD